MKLLGWISCKLRSINPAPLKDSGTAGNPSRSSLNSSWKDQKDHAWPYYEFDKDDEYEEDKGDIFPGFLSIGTLNMDSIATPEPPTPTFGLPSDQEDNIEGTISDMKLISDELEKFLKMEAEGLGESRRTSEASTITLSGTENDLDQAKAFPLQGYLFASSYDVSASAKMEKGTLLELFRRSRDGDNYSCVKIGQEKEDEEALRKHKGPTMRRFLKPLQHSCKKNEAFKDEDSTEPSLPRKRFQKIKQLFHRKVNPEDHHTAVKGSNKLNCNKKNARNTVDSHVSNGGPASSRKRSSKKTSYSAADRSINVEQWIRTDADYLVLELDGM